MAALQARAAAMALRRAPALFGNIRSMSKVARAPITFRPRPGTVIPENAISKEMYDDLAHHGEGIKRMMYFFYFACLPGLAALGYYNYIVEVNHMAHLEEHPADRTVYPYNRYEEKYAWNNSFRSAFHEETVNPLPDD